MTMNARRSLAAGLAATLVAVVLAACGGDDTSGGATPSASTTAVGNAGYPVTVASCGNSHVYKRAPTSVIMGWPEDAKTLNALGVGDSVTGYISAKFGPTPDLPHAKKLSKEGTVSAETALTAKPDLFLAHGGYQVDGNKGSPSVKDLEKAGAGAYEMSGYCKDFGGETSVDQAYKAITDLGKIYGVPEKAAEVIQEARKRVASARAPRGDRKAPRIAYVNVFDGKMYALKGLSYDAQIRGAGGVNVFASLKGNFPEVSPEKVLTLNADAIAYSYGNGGEAEAKQRGDVIKLLGKTKAVKSGRLVGIPVRLSEGSGLAVVDAIEMMANGVYK